MFQKTTMMAVCLMFALAAVVHADFSLQKWRYLKEINVPKSGLVSVTLDNEIFANSSKGLADVRILDGAKQEVPYKLLAMRQEDGRTDYQPKLTNNSVVTGKYSMAILEMEQGITTNSITVKTPSENFQRNAVIYGSDDRSNWNVLKSDGYIYDYTDKKAGVKSSNTTVLFPDSTFKFLKIEISDVDNNPVAIGSITASRYTQKNAQEFSITPTFDVSQDSSMKATILLVDLGQSGIPVGKLSLSVGDSNFNRGVSVFAGKSKDTTDWKNVGQGYIFRYDTPKFVGENTAMTIVESTDRFLKIVIFNKDNAPLAISQIKAFATYRELVFNAQGAGTYKLFYGNDKAQAPEYDLEKYFQYFDLTNIQKMSPGSQKANPGFVAEQKPEEPFSERFPFLLPAALSIAGLLLLAMVYKFLKK
jgi:hypothetical protein